MSDEQGSLDSLCGIYSVVNAVNLLHPMKKGERHALFQFLMLELQKDNYATPALLYGTYRRHIMFMLKATCGYMRRHYEISLSIKPLFTHNARIDRERFCDKLHHYLQTKHHTVIICFEGRLYHWSCVRAFTGTSMLLEDSCGYRYIRKSACRIGKPGGVSGHYITPTHTIGLSIKK